MLFAIARLPPGRLANTVILGGNQCQKPCCEGYRIHNSEEKERGQGGSPTLIVFQLPLFSFRHIGRRVYARARHRCHTPTG